MEKYRKLFPIFGFVAGIVFTLLIFVSYTSTDKSDDILKTFYDLPQRVMGIKMTKKFDFAGEPMLENDDTKERLDRELSVNAYWQSATLLNLKMAHKYFPTVERILAEQGTPDDFKYLAIAESGLRNVGSPAGAKGYWQFMKAASTDMGLELSDEVDERMHLEKSTLAAAKYINQLYRRFGSWTNVAGAYNVGPTSFARSMTEQQEKSYYDMNINDETSRYVFRIIAIKEILKNPADFGFYLDDEEKYMRNQSLKELKVTSTIPSLADFAHSNNTTYRLLKFYNPWLISSKLTVGPNKSYIIKIPS